MFIFTFVSLVYVRARTHPHTQNTHNGARRLFTL